MTRRTKDRLLLTVCAVGFLACCTMIARGEEPRRSRLWRISVAAVAGASAADYATSLGHYERNGLLAGADGRFSPGRAIAFKLGPQAGLLYWQARSRNKRLWAVVNFAMAGVYGATAVYNRRQK
jgi:hypothetical protein